MSAFYLKTTGDSTITLAERLDIENYACGLMDVSGQLIPENDENFEEEYFLCSSISEDVFVNNTKLPVLRRLKFKKSNGIVNSMFRKIIWLKVISEPISKINIYITDSKGKRVSFRGKGLVCTLLLRPNKY